MLENGDKISIELPCRAEYVSVARLCVSGVAGRMGFDIDTIEDIKVVVSEVCSKIIDRYSRQISKYKIDFIIEEDALSIDFPLTEYSEKKVFRIYADELAKEVISALVDDVNFSKKGSFIFMTKTLGRAINNG